MPRTSLRKASIDWKQSLPHRSPVYVRAAGQNPLLTRTHPVPQRHDYAEHPLTSGLHCRYLRGCMAVTVHLFVETNFN